MDKPDFVRDPAPIAPDNNSYFESYRAFLEYFKQMVDPDDQLPVRVPSFTLEESEITGSIVDWMIQYLNDKWVLNIVFLMTLMFVW